MRSLLHQLYAGELCPADNILEGNSEYDTLYRKSLREMDCFAQKLDRDMRREFELMMEHYLELTYFEKSQTFCDGFRIGAGMMCEVFGPAGHSCSRL